MERADAQKLQDFFQSNTTLWIGAVVAFLAAGFAIHWIRNWYRDGDGPTDDTDQILQEMHELHRQGQISDEEFRSIKSQLRRPGSS